MELARNLKSDNVARLRPSPAQIVQTDCTIGDAIKLMREKKVGCLVICAGKQLSGIFTERDVLKRVFLPGRSLLDPIREVMTPDPVTVMPRDPIRRALQRMENGGYRHVPVIDEVSRPVGMLSVKRLIHYLAEHFAATVYNQPPDQVSYPLHRGGA